MTHSNFNQSARLELSETIVAEKLKRNLTWEAIAEGTGLSVVYVTAAALGQHGLSEAAAKIVGARLGLNDDAIALLQTIPLRGGLENAIPSDPTVYRFYEMVLVYGTTLKELVHEKFGDGIISAVNFKIGMEKVDDPDGGHRARIILDGKFLPYKPF